MDGITFMDKNFEVVMIIVAVLLCLIIISIVIYAVKYRTVNSAIRSEGLQNEAARPSTSNYEPLSPNAIRFDNIPFAGSSSAFLTIPIITRTYDHQLSPAK